MNIEWDNKGSDDCYTTDVTTVEWLLNAISNEN